MTVEERRAQMEQAQRVAIEQTHQSIFQEKVDRRKWAVEVARDISKTTGDADVRRVLRDAADLLAFVQGE